MNLLNVCDHRQQIKITVVKKFRKDSIVLSKFGIDVHQYKLFASWEKSIKEAKGCIGL
jgi:hypothetical protein